MTDKNKGGRPTLYTPELATEICDAIASSSVGIAKLCKENPSWPHRTNIYRWLAKQPEFKEQYSHAKICQIELLVDEILEIADDSSQDAIINDQGVRVCNSEFIARSRLRIDTRKWLACKLVPKVYGMQSKESSTIDLTLVERLIDSLVVD